MAGASADRTCPVCGPDMPRLRPLRPLAMSTPGAVHGRLPEGTTILGDLSGNCRTEPLPRTKSVRCTGQITSYGAVASAAIAVRISGESAGRIRPSMRPTVAIPWELVTNAPSKEARSDMCTAP